MSVGLLTLQLSIPGCASLKEKRSRIKPLIARLRREFNVSVAEMERLDSWQEAVIGCTLISNDPAQTQRSLQAVVSWIETYWPDLEVSNDEIELW